MSLRVNLSSLSNKTETSTQWNKRQWHPLTNKSIFQKQKELFYGLNFCDFYIRRIQESHIKMLCEKSLLEGKKNTNKRPI